MHSALDKAHISPQYYLNFETWKQPISDILSNTLRLLAADYPTYG